TEDDEVSPAPVPVPALQLFGRSHALLDGEQPADHSSNQIDPHEHRPGGSGQSSRLDAAAEKEEIRLDGYVSGGATDETQMKHRFQKQPGRFCGSQASMIRRADVLILESRLIRVSSMFQLWLKLFQRNCSSLTPTVG